MNYLFYKLILFLNTAQKDDLNYVIAEYIVKHAELISETDMNITVLANACHVSPASVSRFCRKFGFDDYSHLKNECDVFLHYKLGEYADQDMMNDPVQASKHIVENLQMQLDSQVSALDFESIDFFLQDLSQASTVALYGSHFSHSIAELFQTNMISCGMFCVAKTDMDSQIASAEELGEDDVAVIISVRGNYLDYKEHRRNQRLAKAIQKSGAKIYYITANHDPMLAKESDGMIYITNSEDMYMGGRYILLSFIELLSSRMFAFQNHE